MYSLSNEELRVLEIFRRRALKGGMIRKPWATAESFPPILESICRTDRGMTARLQAPIDKVAKFLSSRLKPSRSQISVVKLANGSLQEYKVEPNPRNPAPLPTVEDYWEDICLPALAVAATTVAVPVRGCPMPEFAKAEIRATKVLETFLNPRQLDDFRRTNQFVTIGQDTGHRYLLTSRLKLSGLPECSRSLTDLDLKQAICVHDWDVPAAEELLGLHLFLSLPGWESWMLQLPE